MAHVMGEDRDFLHQPMLLGVEKSGDNGRSLAGFFILTMHDLGWVNIFYVTWNLAVLVVWAALSGE